MFGQVSMKSVMKNGLLIVLGMVMGVFVVGGRPFTSQTASADTQATPALVEQSSPEGTSWITCVPVDVMSHKNRVHVHCASAVGNISYFAASTSNPAHAARILSTLSAAQISGRTLNILYDPDDTSGTEFGCLAADCRVLIAAGFGQ